MGESVCRRSRTGQNSAGPESLWGWDLGPETLLEEEIKQAGKMEGRLEVSSRGGRIKVLILGHHKASGGFLKVFFLKKKKNQKPNPNQNKNLSAWF